MNSFNSYQFTMKHVAVKGGTLRIDTDMAYLNS